MGISENIKRLRNRADLTQEQLAGMIGVTRATVTQWETGWSKPRMGAVEKLAEVFGVPLSAIVDDKPSGESKLPTNAIRVKGMEMGWVPLLGRVHAGAPDYPSTYDGEMALVPQFLIDRDPDCYALLSEGDCMNRVYPEGCLIVVSPNSTPSNGSVAVVTIDRQETVMRRLYRTSQTLVLSPDSFNPDHRDIVITGDEDHFVEFGGKVVWFQAAKEME